MGSVAGMEDKEQNLTLVEKMKKGSKKGGPEKFHQGF
jgi:hypothetical protein